MRRRLPALLLVVAVALAGTGASVAVVRSTTDGGRPADPRRAAVEALARRPQDVADSARYLVRYIVERAGVGRDFGSYEGTADLRHQRFLARARLVRDDGPPRESDLFVFGQWQYVRSAGEREWSRRFLQPQDLGAPTPELTIVGRRGDNLAAPAYAGDLGMRRRIVDALVAGVAGLGREEQHGAEVWHYRVTVEGDRAVSRLPGPVLREMRAWAEGQGRRDLDLWIDGRGRLRKLSILYADRDGLGFRVENELWDLDGPGRIDLPVDLGDPSAIGGEGQTSYSAPGVQLDRDSPGLVVSVFSPDRPGDEVALDVDDRPAVGGETRSRFFRLRPAAGRHLEPGDLRLVGVGELNHGVPLTVDLSTPEVEARCPRGQPRSGTLTVVEAVRYGQGYYVRMHVRFTVRCRRPEGGAPVSVTGEARYYALT